MTTGSYLIVKAYTTKFSVRKFIKQVMSSEVRIVRFDTIHKGFAIRTQAQQLTFFCSTIEERCSPLRSAPLLRRILDGGDEENRE